jgi:uncharacterized membrane protein
MNSLLTAKNITFLMVGILVIVIGYVLLAQGPVDNVLSITVAPFLLVISYCVLIPVAIILKDNKQKKTK